MGHLNSALLRLEYEILNVSLATLSDNYSVPITILEDQAKNENWKQWWPEEDPDAAANSFATQAEEYTEMQTKRLQVFAIARELYLAPKCLHLEAAIIQAATDAVQNTDVASDSNSLRQMAALYKDIASRSLLERVLGGKADESGIPSVIIRNLAGSAGCDLS